jgi:Holliday junction resolvase RusA-like endonuclease
MMQIPAVAKAKTRRDVLLAVMKSGCVHGTWGKPSKRKATAAQKAIPGFYRAIQEAWRETKEEPFAKGVPLVVSMTAWFERPASVKAQMKVTMPDVDNLEKCWDALNGLAWHDDRQIVRPGPETGKFYAPAGCRPCLVITITEADPADVPEYPEEMKS